MSKKLKIRTRSVKLFNDTPVPSELVTELTEVARNAPTSMGILVTKMKVVSDEEVKKKLKPLCFNQPQIESCSHLILLLTEITEHNAIVGKLGKKDIEDTDLFCEKYKKELISINRLNPGGLKDTMNWKRNQSYLTLGMLVNSCSELGIDSCPMEGFNKSEVSKLFPEIEGYEVSVMLAIGYRHENDPRKNLTVNKFSKDEFIL